jgi:hypothetical protein
MDSRPGLSQHRDLQKLADLLDSKFRLPGGFRIGWDGIIGFIPGIGDLLTNLVSLYIIFRAAMLGCPPSVVLRMGLNVLVDNFVDLIPVLGNFFDIFWQSNNRNITLFERYQTSPQPTVRSARMVIVGTLMLVTLMLLGSVVLVGYMALWVWNYIATQST